MADLLFKEFSKLNTNDEDIIDESCMTIRSLFEKAKRNGAKTLLLEEQLLPFIKLGLQHPSDVVQLTTVRQIQDTLTNARSLTLSWLHANQLLPTLITLLRSTTSVASAIINLLKDITTSKDNETNQLLSKQFIDTVNNFFEESKRNKDEEQSSLLRILDVVALLVHYDPLSMTEQLASPLKYLVVSAVDDTDTLVRLGFIELVTRLGENFVVLKWIVEQSGFLQSFTTMLADAVTQQSESADPILVNGVLTMLTNWFASNDLHVQLLLQDSDLRSSLFAMLAYCVDNHRSTSQQMAMRCIERAIDVVGAIGSHSSGLQFLMDNNRTLVASYVELSIRAPDSISVPSRHQLSAWLQSSNNPTALLESALSADNGLDRLAHGLNQSLSSPIEEVKTAALRAIQSLCFHAWGAKAILSQPGLFEYLISRSVENTKIMREWKFTIVQTLVTKQSQILNTANFKTQWKQLEDYHRFGIHYLPSEANVSVATQEM